MIPKLREWPLLVRLGVGPAWRDRPPRIRTCQAAARIWRALGVW